jgi:Cell Wall Hydrolase
MDRFVLPGWLTYAKRSPNKLPKEKLKLTFRTPSRGEVQKKRSTHRPQRGGYRGAFDMPVEEPKPLLSYAPYVFGGAMLFAAFAFAGHQMGQNASAHNLAQDDKWADLVAPSSHFVTKGALMPTAEVELRSIAHQTVMSGGKAAFLNDDPMADIASASNFAPARTVKSAMAIMDKGKANGLIIEPAGIDLSAKAGDQDAPVLKRLAVTPPVSKLEATFKLKRADKQKVVAQRRVRLAEENCLARAIYFEARSESELGQLAVAKVILNRTRDPNYPKTICGVVYQGANRSNSCQFSFACDGSPDEPRTVEAWNRSKRVAQKALAGDQSVRVMSAATHYHADYVKPRWAKSMKRLIKIGRHIFYQDT